MVNKNLAIDQINLQSFRWCTGRGVRWPFHQTHFREVKNRINIGLTLKASSSEGVCVCVVMHTYYFGRGLKK